MPARLWWMVAVLAAAGCAPAAITPAPTASLALRLMPSATSTLAPAAVESTPPASPVIIASPTATATPVTHVVVEGETLVSIAYDHGVSVEALQAANPAVSPRYLSLGAVLIIPPPEGAAAMSATQVAPPPPAEVDVGPAACHAARSGPLYCFIEARNSGDAALENVSARLTLAGADGLPFASAVAYAALDVIPPGGAVPLAAVFQPAPGEPIAAIGAEVLTADRVTASSAGAVLLEIPTHQAAASGTRLAVRGEVANPGPDAVSAVWVVVTLYDANGLVTGYRELELAGLASGEVRSFSLTATSLAGPVNHYTVLAEGRR